jgi:NAD(P)-dependent dehydrogenase (short-subunit alcohol dehydrogenase family)
MELAGRAALVTGGAAGIGSAIASALEHGGARVLSADLADAPIRVDLSRPGEALRMVDEAVDQLSGLDVLVNNAGGYSSPTYPAAADWRSRLELNLGAVMEAIRHALPALAEGGGSVVNVASSAGLGNAPYTGVEYAVAKAGVIRLTTALCTVDGVRINCVCPHTVATESVLRALETRTLEALAPPPATLLEVGEVVDGVLRLIADDSLSGRVLLLAGGQEPRFL